MPADTGRRPGAPENAEALVGALALGVTVAALVAGAVGVQRDGLVAVATHGALVLFSALITVVIGHVARRVARRTGAGRRLSLTVVTGGWMVLVATVVPVPLMFLALAGISL